MSEKIVQMKRQGTSAPVSNKSKIDEIQEGFSKNVQGVATSFGALLGMTKWYGDMFPKAMEQLKANGCQYCGHRHCADCKEQSRWTWDMGESHEG